MFLALASCYCNDLYREAARKNIGVRSVQIEVSGEFDPAPGSAAENIRYRATVEAEASEVDILELMRHPDTPEASRKLAESLWLDLESELCPRVIWDAKARAREVTLADVVGEVLDDAIESFLS